MRVLRNGRPRSWAYQTLNGSKYEPYDNHYHAKVCCKILFQGLQFRLLGEGIYKTIPKTIKTLL